MKNREDILNDLANEYSTSYAGNGYPLVFKPQAFMVQCNFGGLCIIVSNSGDSAIVWSDWSDTAIDEKLTECEIEFVKDENIDEEDLVAAIKYNNTYYPLNLFLIS